MPAEADTPVLSPWRAHTPNALTVSRVVLAAGLFVMLSLVEPPAASSRPPIDPLLLACCAVFVVAALTDALDGYLARRWRAFSAFGRIMDPFADKLLVVGSFIYLASPAFAVVGPSDQTVQASGVEPWMVVIILGRELLVTSIRGVLEAAGIAFPAVWSGKAKMILQSAVVPIILLLLGLGLGWPWGGGPWRGLILALVWLTAVMTAWSGVPYVLSAIAALRHARTTHASPAPPPPAVPGDAVVSTTTPETSP